MENKIKNPKRGLHAKIIAGVIIPLMIVLCVVGMYLSDRMSQIVNNLKSTDITAQAQAGAEQTEAFFEPYITTTKIMADLDVTARLLAEVQSASPSFDIHNAETYKEAVTMLQDIEASHDGELLSACVAFFHNSQYLGADGSTSDKGWDATTRPWYIALEQSGGKPALSPAYIDNTTGKIVVTVATGIFDSKNNMVGAACIDISLDSLTQTLSKIKIGKEGYVVVYDDDFNIIYHPNSDYILNNLDDMHYSSNMYELLSNHQDSDDVMEYTRGNVKLYGYTNYLEDLNWQVLGCLSYDEFASEQQTTSRVIMLSFAICIALLFTICVLLAGAIVRPIKHLDEVAARLAEGDLDIEVTADTNDEVGALANNISSVVARLKTYITYINEVSDILDQFGKGDLIFDLKQDYVGEFDRLKVAMLNIQKALSTTLFHIVDSAYQVDSSTNQIAAASQSLAQGSSEQASTVQELAATVQELSGKSVTEAEKALVLRDNITGIGDDLLKNNEQMKEMMTAMEDITTQSNEISKVIKAIEDIAFQTNILALNAAVEAARAGEAGKGFAVVADEVRNLATKSSEAAKDTSRLIENSIQSVKNGSAIADQTADALAKIVTIIGNIVPEMEAFAAQYQEQTGQLGQISSGIDQIASVVQTNSATAEETAAASEEVSGQSRLMRELTAQFRLDEQFHQAD